MMLGRIAGHAQAFNRTCGVPSLEPVLEEYKRSFESTLTHIYSSPCIISIGMKIIEVERVLNKLRRPKVVITRRHLLTYGWAQNPGHTQAFLQTGGMPYVRSIL